MSQHCVVFCNRTGRKRAGKGRPLIPASHPPPKVGRVKKVKIRPSQFTQRLFQPVVLLSAAFAFHHCQQYDFFSAKNQKIMSSTSSIKYEEKLRYEFSSRESVECVLRAIVVGTRTNLFACFHIQKDVFAKQTKTSHWFEQLFITQGRSRSELYNEAAKISLLQIGCLQCVQNILDKSDLTFDCRKFPY